MNRYLKSIVNDFVIPCDEIIDMPNTVSMNLIDKKETFKIGGHYFLLNFY